MALRCEAIAIPPALHQWTTDRFLERGEPPLHSRLIDAEPSRCCTHAAAAGESREVAQIVPVEHPALTFLPPRSAKLRLPATAIKCYRIADGESHAATEGGNARRGDRAGRLRG
jgi:hypothetical protein